MSTIEAQWRGLTEACTLASVSAYVGVAPLLLFATSHHGGLFGFVVQEGLCAQLAYFYKFSLYDVR